jgi:2-polyprenyl-3-methyl-5-hydroxy-6-metoxy-1,4-benzoquinol methylase
VAGTAGRAEMGLIIQVTMANKAHWESVYETKAPEAVSWYRAHLDESIRLIERSCPDKSASIIDVGGGESTLVDDLLERGYRGITVMDISEKALEVARERLGTRASHVNWVAADITSARLPDRRYDVWHDRAVFHFLTRRKDRAAYVRQVASSVKAGGYVIVATFGPGGPTKCSGLDVVRYDSASLHSQFGASFRLEDSVTEIHQTPFGTTQQFLYCLCRVI